MSRSKILDYQAGRAARIKGVPRDGRKNIDWLRGWDDVQAARDAAWDSAWDAVRASRDAAWDAEDAEAKWQKGQEP